MRVSSQSTPGGVSRRRSGLGGNNCRKQPKPSNQLLVAQHHHRLPVLPVGVQSLHIILTMNMIFKLRSGLFRNEPLPDAFFMVLSFSHNAVFFLRPSVTNMADSRKKEIARDAALPANIYLQE